MSQDIPIISPATQDMIKNKSNKNHSYVFLLKLLWFSFSSFLSAFEFLETDGCMSLSLSTFSFFLILLNSSLETKELCSDTRQIRWQYDKRYWKFEVQSMSYYLNVTNQSYNNAITILIQYVTNEYLFLT